MTLHSGLWLWDHRRERIVEIDTDERMHHRLWMRYMAAVKGRQQHQGRSAEGEQDWREHGQRARRLSMDGGGHG